MEYIDFTQEKYTIWFTLVKDNGKEEWVKADEKGERWGSKVKL